MLLTELADKGRKDVIQYLLSYPEFKIFNDKEAATMVCYLDDIQETDILRFLRDGVSLRYLSKYSETLQAKFTGLKSCFFNMKEHHLK